MMHGIDWGAYLSSVKGPAIPFKDLHDAGLLDFFITKGCQEDDYHSSIKNIQWAREAGVKCVGSYYWHYPTWNSNYQIEIYSSAIYKENPDFIALDMEGSYGCSDWQITTNAEEVCEGLAKNFPDLKLFIYTSADFINGFCPTFNRSINKYKRWIACWPGVIPTGPERYLSFDEIKQYPLSGWIPKLPTGWSGWDIWQNNNWAIPEGYGWPYNHQYDWNVSNLTIEQITGNQEETMAGIHDTRVPMDKRAWVMEIKSDCKITSGFSSLGIDALILPMVGMPWDGSHQRVVAETTFQGRVQEAGSIPVFGKIVLDAGIVTTEQHTKPELDGHNIWQNLVVPKILDAWHVGAWTQSTLKPEDFFPVKALIFEQVAEIDHYNPGKPIGDFWQAYFFRYVVDKLRVLMASKAIPEIPLILKTTPEWLQKYSVDFSIMLQDGRKSWLYLDLSVPKLDSTAVYPDLWSIYQHAPGDEFSFSYVPDGYFDRVLLYEFTAGKQQMQFSTGNRLAYLSLWCDELSGMTEFLGNIEPPTEPSVPPPPSGDLEIRVSVLEQNVKTLEEKIISIVSQLRNIHY